MNTIWRNRKSAGSHLEWLGLICVFIWFFCSMFSYYEPLFTDTLTVLVFMLLLCIGLAACALLFEKKPMLINKAVLTFTLAGIACTTLIPLLPANMGIIIYWFSALLMTPLLCRRIYGVLSTASENSRIRTYISAVSVTIVVQMAWVLLPIPYEAKFPIVAIFAFLGLIGAGARLPVYHKKESPMLISKRKPAQYIRLAVILVLLILLNLFNTLIHTHVISDTLEGNELFSLAAWAIAPLAFFFFAWLSDKKKDRLGFVLAITTILLGCFVALIPEDSVLTAPLLLSGEFGGTITEFCFLTMPLLFFPYTKRPMLVASTGLIIHTLLSSAVSWTQDLWLPSIFLREQIGRPLVIGGAVCAVALIPLVFSVWRRQQDVSLMAAMIGFRDKAEDKKVSQISPEGDWMNALDLLENEHRAAMLLCEGLTRAEIAERMALSSAGVSLVLRNIRSKLENKEPLGYSSEAIKMARQYKLTSRETEVLGEILLGRSNAEICANLYIEEPTVKTHVGKVFKKTGVSSRSELVTKAHL